jgi:hypothetical protein
MLDFFTFRSTILHEFDLLAEFSIKLEFTMLRTLLLLTLFGLSASFGHAATAETETGPKMYLPENLFVFPPVPEGTEVVHDFVLFNHGDQPLELSNVKSG